MLDALGIDPAAAVAIGDAENDVEMLRVVGVGAAVANAQPDALAAADVVVASNVDNGVAEAARRFVLPEVDVTPLEFFTLDMCPYARHSKCLNRRAEAHSTYAPS